MIASHVEHVSMSAQQELSLRAISILSTLMFAQSAAHVLMFVLLRQSACLHNLRQQLKRNRGFRMGALFFLFFMNTSGFVRECEDKAGTIGIGGVELDITA